VRVRIDQEADLVERLFDPKAPTDPFCGHLTGPEQSCLAKVMRVGHGKCRSATSAAPGQGSAGHVGAAALAPQQRMFLRTAAMELNDVRTSPCAPPSDRPARRGGIVQLLEPLRLLHPRRQILDSTLKRAIIALAHDDVHLAAVAIDERGAQRGEVCGRGEFSSSFAFGGRSMSACPDMRPPPFAFSQTHLRNYD